VSPTPFAYLAHPIDLVEDARRLTEETCYLMQQNGLAAYIPSYAFKIPAGAAPNEVLNRINRAALTECDALVAILPKVGQTSFGVFYEIEQARAEGKPTLMVHPSCGRVRGRCPKPIRWCSPTRCRTTVCRRFGP
jgi:nucleoside 2-deoxyribosyltransferase